MLDVLVIETDAETARRLADAFPRGTRHEVVGSTELAERVLEKTRAKVLICADDLEEESGIMFLARTQDKWIDMQRILIAPALDPELFFYAMKEVKLFHYLNKPVNPSEVARVVSRSLSDFDAPPTNQLPSLPDHLPDRIGPDAGAAGEPERRGFAGGLLIGLCLSIAAAALFLVPLALYLLKSLAGIDFFPDSHLRDWLP